VGNDRSYFFAGGGTGGHIYPAIAVAEQIASDQRGAGVSFFCSERAIDKRVLSTTDFEYITLPAVGASIRPDRVFKFVFGFIKSFMIARTVLKPVAKRAIVVGTGGFISVPVVMAARSLKIPVALINVDIVPGKANKVNAKFAQQAFVHFRETADYFKKRQVAVEVVGVLCVRSFWIRKGAMLSKGLGLILIRRRY
jgi:UDP-N-acetylglucosamine--N-acetylmuramyl-(pentapeptide) pyrophosphoryl-undecaprenol N-acetylglucosamine transferase